MKENSAFTKQITLGFAGTVLAAVTVGIVSVFAMKSVLESTGHLAIHHSQGLASVERLRSLAVQEVSLYRGFLFSKDHVFLSDAKLAHTDFDRVLGELQARASNPDETALLESIKTYSSSHRHALLQAVGRRKIAKKITHVRRFFSDSVMPHYDDLEQSLDQFAKLKTSQYEQARNAVDASAKKALHFIITITVASIGLAVILVLILTHTLTRMHKTLMRTIGMRDDLMAMASHDLKNPLTAILMSAGLHLRYPGKKDPTQAFELIDRSARHMRRLIDDLLDLTKITAGKMNLNLAIEDPTHILNEVLEMLKPIADSKSVKMECEADGDIPFVSCDRGRVTQVLSNLIGNAIKFTPPHGTVKVCFSQKDHSNALIEVRDTGPGIPAKELPFLFDRYWQSSKNSRTGSGLGLYITKNLVEAHDGKIWVESTLDSGSTFYFTLPLVHILPEQRALSAPG